MSADFVVLEAIAEGENWIAKEGVSYLTVVVKLKT
jgi:hypothetical protein